MDQLTRRSCAGRAFHLPTARWLAYRDKDQQLWLYDIKTKQPKLIAQSMVDDFYDLTWSPDSQWLAYVEAATNTFSQIKC